MTLPDPVDSCDSLPTNRPEVTPLPLFRFHRSQRLRNGIDFERVYRRRLKGADGTLLVFIDLNHSNTTRLGLSVARKHGGAVVRGRLKRWLREAFRLEQHSLMSGIDIICIPLDQERASLSAYRKSLRQLTDKLVRRIRSTEAEDRR